MTRDELMTALTALANLKADGHYTIMKFTTGYRVCLGTITDRDDIDTGMYAGDTLEEAISNLIRSGKYD